MHRRCYPLSKQGLSHRFLSVCVYGEGCLASHLSEEGTVLCVSRAALSTVWASLPLFASGLALLLGILLLRGFFIPVFLTAGSSSGLHFASCHTIWTACFAALIFCVLFCFLAHCFSALRRKTYVILGFGSMSCHSGFAPLPAEWRKDGRGELQVLNFPASSLSSCPLYPANQGCVIPRQVFLISSHLVALTSVCLSGAANYNDLLFVCRFSSALACLSCSVVVPVMPSRGRPRCLFPTLTKADETSCLL